MHINKVELHNFRNYENQEIKLKKNINVFYGDNAQGKTNILEAIFLCAFGKSFRTTREKELIKLGEENARIKVEYSKKDRDGNILICISDKKQILVNGVKIKKLSELLGKINIVIFTPDDINILKGTPALRRRFLDMMIGQLRPNYVYILNMYNKTLEQRNNYLRQIRQEGKAESLLEIWDEKLVEYGNIISNYRREFINKIIEKINIIHKKITNDNEKIDIIYTSCCENKKNYMDLLTQRRKLDIIKGYTTKGIHRDDFEVYINDKELSIYGSQGQNRTAVLSLKLSELQVIHDEIEEEPILLLDDFMSELDIKRRRNFLNNINNTQVIITCAEKINFINESVDYYLYQVKKGEII